MALLLKKSRAGGIARLLTECPDMLDYFRMTLVDYSRREPRVLVVQCSHDTTMSVKIQASEEAEYYDGGLAEFKLAYGV